MSHKSKPLPAWLIDRYRGWRARRFVEDQAWLSRLAEEGQRPRAMIIACCDSRVDVTGMFGVQAGEVFIVRNVANLIPPYSPDGEHHGTSAAIEYAVNHLRVANIIIIGHSDCGGVRAYVQRREDGAEQAPGGDFIGRWLDLLRGAFDTLPEGEHDACRALEKHAVVESLSNLRSFPFVAEAVEEGRLNTHGAWYDIGNGQLQAWRADEGKFIPIDP